MTVKYPSGFSSSAGVGGQFNHEYLGINYNYLCIGQSPREAQELSHICVWREKNYGISMPILPRILYTVNMSYYRPRLR
jgi:hypothetical protein